MAYEAEKRLILNHQAVVRQVRNRVKAYASSRWFALGSWRDADIDRFVDEIVPVVQSGQRQVGQLTNSYFDSMARLMGITPMPLAPAVLDARGVDPEQVYRRPAVTTYIALSEGKTLTEALSAGAARLSSIVDMDMQLAHTRTASLKMASSGFTYYRRILTGAENCSLCVLASSQRYRVGNLMPIHPGCDCTVSPPILAGYDPGQVINEDAYDRAMSALEQEGVTSHSGNRDATNILIREHGEFGPTLTWRNQRFTGPDDIK